MVGITRDRGPERGSGLVELLIVAAIIALIVALLQANASGATCKVKVIAIKAQLTLCNLLLTQAETRGITPAALGQCVTDAQKLIKKYASHLEWWPKSKGALKILWVAFKTRYDRYLENNPNSGLPEALDQPIYIGC